MHEATLSDPRRAAPTPMIRWRLGVVPNHVIQAAVCAAVSDIAHRVAIHEFPAPGSKNPGILGFPHTSHFPVKAAPSQARSNHVLRHLHTWGARSAPPSWSSSPPLTRTPCLHEKMKNGTRRVIGDRLASGSAQVGFPFRILQHDLRDLRMHIRCHTSLHFDSFAVRRSPPKMRWDITTQRYGSTQYT